MAERVRTTIANGTGLVRRNINSLKKSTQQRVNGIKTSLKEGKEALMQQRLKAWQPVLTPKYVKSIECCDNRFLRWVIVGFGSLGLCFIILGAVLLGVCNPSFCDMLCVYSIQPRWLSWLASHMKPAYLWVARAL